MRYYYFVVKEGEHHSINRGSLPHYYSWLDWGRNPLNLSENILETFILFFCAIDG